MKRPFWIRLVPTPVKEKVYRRLYRARANRWPELFQAASLHFMPNVKMMLQPDDISHGYIAFAGYHELALTRRMVEHARCGGLLADVGANFGYYSLLWAGCRPDNHVIAFEASPRNCQGLHQNIRVNGLSSQITVREVAVGKTVGRVQFMVDPNGQGSWSGISAEQAPNTIDVPIITLDSFFDHGEVIAVLKVDVEGADAWVLQGASELLQQRRIRRVYFEQNKVRMRSLGIHESEATSFLSGLSYAVQPISDPRSRIVEYTAFPT
ncbi:MAG TPA: FkbM family methyltransferase [Anaerolineae bacterium]|nr:FkbM family methyltransferase [Anaerolineae bacterium]